MTKKDKFDFLFLYRYNLSCNEHCASSEQAMWRSKGWGTQLTGDCVFFVNVVTKRRSFGTKTTTRFLCDILECSQRKSHLQWWRVCGNTAKTQRCYQRYIVWAGCNMAPKLLSGGNKQESDREGQETQWTSYECGLSHQAAWEKKKEWRDWTAIWAAGQVHKMQDSSPGEGFVLFLPRRHRRADLQGLYVRDRETTKVSCGEVWESSPGNKTEYFYLP